jgi:hypothetical protein
MKSHYEIALVVLRERLVQVYTAIQALERLQDLHPIKARDTVQECLLTGAPCSTRQWGPGKSACWCAECVAYADENNCGIASTDNSGSPDSHALESMSK